MKKKSGKRLPPAAKDKNKVVSIAPLLQRQRMDQAHERAASTHRRQLESVAEMSEHEAAMERMNLEEGIAWCEKETSREARVSWVTMRSLRALRSCKRGDVAAGLAEWAEIIAAEPGIAETYLIRSRWLGQTDVPAALADCERAVAAEPQNATAYARRGDCHRVLGDAERALADYRRAVALDPEVFDVHYTMGTVLAGLGKHEEARAAYGKAIRLAPRYVEFYLGRAHSLQELGDHAGAMRDLDRALQLDPTHADVRTLRSICLAMTGDLRGAVTELVAATGGGLNAKGSLVYTLLGGVLLGTGKAEQALAAFDRALQLDPDDVSALSRRAKIHTDAARYEPALRDLDHALTLTPDDADLHVARSKPLAHLGRFADGVSSLSRALELAPDNVLAYRWRAVFRSHAEDMPNPLVTADMKRAWELSPQTAVIRQEYLDHLKNIGGVDATIAVYDKDLELTPDAAELLYQRAKCKVGRDEELHSHDVEDDETEEQKHARLTSAIADLERVLVLGGCDLEDVHWELIRAHDSLGEPVARMAQLDRAIAALPDFTMPYVQRERWRRAGGDAEGAAADRARLAELGLELPEG